MKQIVIDQIGQTGGILSNNWVGNTYVNRHFVRAVAEEGKKLTKAQKEDSASKFHYPGAIVGNPVLNDFPPIIRNAVDLDYGAMYPTQIVVFNLSPDTIKYKLWIDPSQFRSGLCINNGIGANNDPEDTQWDYGDAILGDYVSGNLIAFMHTWFGCPDIDQIFANIQRERGRI